MTLESSIAVYFVVWWTCLFIILPMGVRNAHEAGVNLEPGYDTGAPVNPMMWRKIWLTTVLSFVVFGVIWSQAKFGWIRFEDIPFMKYVPTG